MGKLASKIISLHKHLGRKCGFKCVIVPMANNFKSPFAAAAIQTGHFLVVFALNSLSSLQQPINRDLRGCGTLLQHFQLFFITKEKLAQGHQKKGKNGERVGKKVNRFLQIVLLHLNSQI